MRISSMDIEDEFEEPADLSARVSHRYCRRIFNSARKLVMFGRFEGIRAIGGGSFGIIFLVRDPQLDREVALKLCKVASEAHRERLVREAQIIAKLSHPNIVTIHEVGCYESDVDDDEHDGSPFIVMELAEGGTGRDLIARRARWEQCVGFYRGAGRGLAAAHAAGVVHGDFKPSNIIAGHGGALVADFGLAHTLGSADEHNGGTPGYMAPELLAGGGNGPLADQWAFCVSLWETLEGVRPFDGNSPVALLESIEAGPPNCNASHAMPPRLRQALQRGLALNPAARWPSMDVLVDELDAIVLQASAPTLTGGARLRAGGLMYAVLGGVLGVLGTMAVVLLMHAAREQPAQQARQRGFEALDRGVPEVAPEVDEAQPSGPACVVSADMAHYVPSLELEAVCKLIRLGRLEEADIDWRAVRAERSPGRQDQAFELKLMNLAKETKIVVDTCDDYASSVADSDLTRRARALSVQMLANYEYDMGKLEPSPP